MKMFDEYYSGSTLLKPLSDRVGIQIDRLNFVICQFTALCFAFLMRRYLHPNTVSAEVRHYFSFLIGISLSYFCFGNEIAHLLIVSTVCYFIIKFQDTKTMQNTVFIVSVGYLAICHIKRIIYNYGAYSLDITGPLMVLVQRVSGLAFSLHDGLACDVDKLSQFRKQYSTQKKPSLIEYYGYLFQFQSILAGPNILFNDYVQFIDGSNFKNAKIKDTSSEPAVAFVVLRKVIVSITCIIIHLGLAGYVPIEFSKTPTFWHEYGPVYQMTYLTVCTTLTRFMYYHAWILAEAVCNASGLGFSGFDKEGNAKWDLAKNVDILGFEFADNIRNAIASWNTGTNAWLRFLVYERMDKYQSYKTVATFMLSAVWHGFYPGYYLCFVTAALLVSAARTVRKFVRPYFLGSKHTKWLYDFSTFMVTKIAVAYFTFPFVMYEFWPAVITYKRMYFFTHIGSALAMFVFPMIRKYFPKPPAPVVN